MSQACDHYTFIAIYYTTILVGLSSFFGQKKKNGKSVLGVKWFMIIISDLKTLKSRGKVTLECEACHKLFSRTKNRVLAAIKNSTKNEIKFNCCSPLCYGKSQTFFTYCKNCNTKIIRKMGQSNERNNYFCSRSCATFHRNANKIKGCRRSKLEVWLETQLTSIFPNLEILYCRKDIIKSELDIYIPSLRLAFELNGPFHYEPIYGEDKLSQIQNNDQRKFQACLEHNIELCIIDSSSLKYFKPANCQKYLDIIVNIINSKQNWSSDKEIES